MKTAMVVGLSAQPKLNGNVVELVKWHDEKQRWQVKTSDNSCSLFVKATNLLRSDEGDPDMVQLFGHSFYG